jgi:hypothetical protein
VISGLVTRQVADQAELGFLLSKGGSGVKKDM